MEVEAVEGGVSASPQEGGWGGFKAVGVTPSHGEKLSSSLGKALPQQRDAAVRDDGSIPAFEFFDFPLSFFSACFSYFPSRLRVLRVGGFEQHGQCSSTAKRTERGGRILIEMTCADLYTPHVIPSHRRHLRPNLAVQAGTEKQPSTRRTRRRRRRRHGRDPTPPSRHQEDCAISCAGATALNLPPGSGQAPSPRIYSRASPCPSFSP